MANKTTRTDLKPFWSRILVARGHVRGCEAISIRFNDLGKMIDASMHLRGIGYTLIRSFPAKEKKN